MATLTSQSRSGKDVARSGCARHASVRTPPPLVWNVASSYTPYYTNLQVLCCYVHSVSYLYSNAIYMTYGIIFNKEFWQQNCCGSRFGFGVGLMRGTFRKNGRRLKLKGSLSVSAWKTKTNWSLQVSLERRQGLGPARSLSLIIGERLNLNDWDPNCGIISFRRPKHVLDRWVLTPLGVSSNSESIFSAIVIVQGRDY